MKNGQSEIERIELWEIKEAFVIQTLSVIEELKIDKEMVNVNGGAIALGVLFGCSVRVRFPPCLMKWSIEKRYGVAIFCGAIGQGVATVIETVE